LCEEDLTLERNILFIEVDLEHLIFVWRGPHTRRDHFSFNKIRLRV
jgi:hypothetical protein